MYFSRRCLTELCVRCSKNISELNGSGFDLVLPQQMHVQRNADRQQPAEEPWREETHY